MEQLTSFKFNKFQTPVNEELKESVSKYVWDNLLEYISSVKFIQNLIAPEEIRGYAKDRPRETEFYNDGRVEVDLTNPHLLEDMDFFRERALFFNRNGKYTNLTPNSNPKSDYSLFWKEEYRRWKYGLVRESDGEWIPGELYYYWNYGRIWSVKKNKDESGKVLNKEAQRIPAFPRPYLGDYLFYHYCDKARKSGKHGKMLKARGIGASFKFAAMSPFNMFTKPGAGNPNFHLASDKSFLAGDKGIWGKILDNLDFIGQNTDLPRMRLIDKRQQVLELQLGYQDEYGARKGLLSSVFGISLKDNPDKARGVRGPLIHYEEDGLFPNLEKAWNVNREATEEDGVAYGFMFAAGTGGTEGADFEGAERLFYSPSAYNIKGIPNVVDKNVNGENEVGFFWGAYLNRGESVTRENGEPDVILSLLNILEERKKILDTSVDPQAITQKKAESCITPQEAVMRTEGTIFPVADLKEYLESILPKKESFLAEHYTGELIYNNLGEVEFKPNSEIYPLRKYEVSGNDNRSGAIEIFEMPRKDSSGTVTNGRYIAGIDPIDADSGSSLFSIMIMDTFTDRIVAEYTGRPRLASEAYEMALKLLKFYNAEANYEKNLKGIYSYFQDKNALRYLCKTPQVLKDMNMIKSNNTWGNNALGTHATPEINKWGRALEAEYMLTRVDPNSEEDLRLKLHTLRGLAYIEECIKWNADGNFDRVSSAGMLFILREDRRRRTAAAIANKDKHIKNLANDAFFSRNFKMN